MIGNRIESVIDGVDEFPAPLLTSDNPNRSVPVRGRQQPLATDVDTDTTSFAGSRRSR